MAKSLFELGDNPTPRPQPRPKREPERKPARAPKVVKVQTRQQPARLDGMTFGLPMPSLMRTPAPKPQAPLHEAVRKPFPKAKPIQQDKPRSKPAPKAQRKPPAIGPNTAVTGKVAQNLLSLPSTLAQQAKGLWDQTVRPAMEHMGAAQTLGDPGASSAAFGMAHGRPDVMASAQETFNDPAKTAASGRVVANTLPLMALGAASKPVQLAAGAVFGVPSAINLNKRRTGELQGFWEDPVMTAMDAAGVAFAPFAARGFVNSIRGLRTPTLPIERVFEPPVPVAEGMREPLLARRGAPVVREPAPAGTFVRKPAGTRIEKGAPLRRRATEKAPVEPAQVHPGVNKAQEPPVVQATVEQAAHAGETALAPEAPAVTQEWAGKDPLANGHRVQWTEADGTVTKGTVIDVKADPADPYIEIEADTWGDGKPAVNRFVRVRPDYVKPVEPTPAAPPPTEPAAPVAPQVEAPAAGKQATVKEPTNGIVPVADDFISANGGLGSESFIMAKKQPTGTYRLFVRGTNNEIFPGKVFQSAAEARNFWKVQNAKRLSATVQPAAPEPVPTVDTTMSTPKAASGKKGAPVKGKKGSTSPAMENVAALPTARTTTAKAETVVRASDIVKDLDKAFAPIRTGRVNSPKAVGIFKGHAGVIRSKKANDLPTVAHETGHALQKLLWPESIGRKGRFTNKAFSPEHRAELRLLDYEPQKGRAYEGYAEFIRHYLTDPATAQQKAPKFFKFFETKIAGHPEVQAALRKAQADIARFIEQPNAAKVRSTISYENTPSRPSARDAANRAYQLMVDELDPLRRAEEAITGGAPIKSTESAFKEAWRGRGISGKMEEWLFHGVTDKNGKKVAASLSERLKPVQGELTEWQDYAVARHALDVIDDGKTMPLSRDAYQSVVDAAPPHYQKVLESVVEYQDYVLEELVRSGMLSASAKADMRRKWPNHVPLYRDMGADLPKGMGKKQANLANPVKRLKGSGRDILPPVENIIRDTYAMLNVAQRNRVMLKLTSLAEKFGDSGRIVEKVPAKMKATSFTLDEVLTGNESVLGTEKGDVSAAGIDLDTVKTIFRPNLAGSRSENIVVVYRNGKPELYQLESGLYDAVTAADTASLGVLETLLVPFTASAKVLRAGATLDPSFAVRNPIRDLMTAMVNSESGLTHVDWVRGLFNTVGRTDLYHQFKASGAAHANLVSLDRDYLGLSVKQMRAKDAPAKVIDFVTHPIEALRALGEIGEESTRVAEFGKGTKWGKESDPSKVLDAALAARDITIDFSRTGMAGKHVNRITAFFNAAVGGADKTVRVFKQNPTRSTTRALAYITAPTVALYAINRNDKRYQDLPEWEKDMFWHIPTPNNGPMIRIPRPFEIGVVFGALPERIMRWIDKEDPHAFDQFSETMKGQLPNLMPTLLTPAWELHGNKSFTGAPIVPRGEQDLPPALQEGPDTTKTAKVIGKALDASPRKVDYAIRGYTGGLGRMANEGIISPVASALGGDAKTVKPSKGITEAPVIKSFFVSPWQQGEDINRLYKERKRLMDKEAMEKAGQGALTPAERRALARLDSGASQLSALRKQMRQVQSENNAARLRAYAAQYGAEVAGSPAQNKKAALLAIKQRMADTAAKANDK